MHTSARAPNSFLREIASFVPSSRSPAFFAAREKTGDHSHSKAYARVVRGRWRFAAAAPVVEPRWRCGSVQVHSSKVRLESLENTNSLRVSSPATAPRSTTCIFLHREKTRSRNLSTMEKEPRQNKVARSVSQK